MCLIVHKMIDDKPLTYEFIADAFNSNSDGWGLIVIDPIKDQPVKEGFLPKNKIIVERGVCHKPKRLWKTIKKYNKGYEFILHLRMRTHGDVNIENTHPYPVGDDILFMHNGVISTVPEYVKGMSDTWHFADMYLKDLLKNHPDPYNYIRSPEFKRYIEHLGGSNNRFALIDPYGVVKYNESTWSKTTKGVCVSNTYAYSVDNPFTFNYSKYNYTKGYNYKKGSTWTEDEYDWDHIYNNRDTVTGTEFFSSKWDNDGQPFLVNGTQYEYVGVYQDGKYYGITVSGVKVPFSDEMYESFLEDYFGVPAGYTGSEKQETDDDKEQRAEHINNLINREIAEESKETNKLLTYSPKDGNKPANSNFSFTDNKKDYLLEDIKWVDNVDDLLEVIQDHPEASMEKVLRYLRIYNYQANDKIMNELISLYFHDHLLADDTEGCCSPEEEEGEDGITWDDASIEDILLTGSEALEQALAVVDEQADEALSSVEFMMDTTDNEENLIGEALRQGTVH